MKTWRDIHFADVKVDRYLGISRLSVITIAEQQRPCWHSSETRWSEMTLGELADEGERSWCRVPKIGPKAIEIIKAIIDDAAAGVDVTAPPPDQAYRPVTRRRLPCRRPSETVGLTFDGTVYAVTIGFDPNGQPGEVFTGGAKVGSALDAILDDACIALSLLLQHGVTPASLAKTMGRTGDGVTPASIVGALVDLLDRVAAEDSQEPAEVSA